MILVNLKVYKETFGEKAVRLAKICRETADKFNLRIVVTTTALDAYRVMKETGAEVWLQHVDEASGKATGAVSMEQALALGIKGSLLNHSEHKLPKGTVLKTIKHKPEGFEIMACAASLGQIEKWMDRASPDWILYEPPELIASKEASVATAKPEAIKHAVELAKSTKIMVGAGVKSRKDAEVSLALGAKGVGLSSAFVLSSDPRAVLEEIAAGFSIQ